MFHWLKYVLPRGLYSRLALIVLLPVIGLQFSVSIAFLQRHFEGVTQQLSGGVAFDLAYVIDQIETATPAQQARRADDLGQSFGLTITLRPPLPENRRAWYDFSGIVVAQTLRDRLPELDSVDLCGAAQGCPTRRAFLGFDTSAGPIVVGLDRSRLSASNPHQLLVIMVVLGAILTLVSFLYLRNQLRPIARLGHAAQAYGRGQILPYKIRGSTEVRAAGAAFLDMRARIERQAEQRRLMLSGVSHDLRSPLTRMRLSLAMMDEGEAEPLLRDVEDMERLVDAFLDFARDEASEITQSADLADILRAAVEDARRAGADVQLTEPEPTILQLRPHAIRRAIDNLMANAHRYAPHMQVSLHQTQKTVQVIIDDDGPGIPAAARENAMRPFYRLDPARNQDGGTGVGLGLAIVADVARSHGGRLVLDESPMGGLRASLVLPK